jgi:hypothetical protein
LRPTAISACPKEHASLAYRSTVTEMGRLSRSYPISVKLSGFSALIRLSAVKSHDVV